jgi:hypothetical protein
MELILFLRLQPDRIPNNAPINQLTIQYVILVTAGTIFQSK